MVSSPAASAWYAVALPVSVAELPNMAHRAGGFSFSQCSSDVLGMGDCFQVVRSTTPSVPAQVVYLSSFWDGADEVFVGDPVDVQHHLWCVPSSQADVQCAVTVGDSPTGPFPAAVLRLNDSGEYALLPSGDAFFETEGHERNNTSW